VFVANPNKPEPIVEILVKNREKLLKYLEEFHTDRGKRSDCCCGSNSGSSCSWHHHIALRLTSTAAAAAS
jgi:hypothetical protein